MSRRDSLPWGRWQGAYALPSWATAAGSRVANPASPLPLDMGEPRAFDYSTGQVVVAAAGTTAAAIRVLSDAGFLVIGLTAQSSTGARSALGILLTDQQRGRAWSSASVRGDLYSGDARFPYLLPVPAYVPPNGVLVAEINDVAGAGLTGEVGIVGYKLERPTEEGLSAMERWSPFAHVGTLEMGAGVGVVADLTLKGHGDADWVLVDRMASERANWGAQFQIASAGGWISNRSVHAALLFGDAERPGTMTPSLRIAAGDDVIVRGTNLQAGATSSIVVLSGSKLYGGG